MLSANDAECWDDAAEEAYTGDDDVPISLPRRVVRAVNNELATLADGVDRTWAKRILCGIGGFLLGAVVGGYLTIDHLRAKAEHVRPPAIVEPGAVRPHAGPGQVKAVL